VKKSTKSYGPGSISETAKKRREAIATSGMSQSAKNIRERIATEKSKDGNVKRGVSKKSKK
jgi:hypothetical protein